MKNFIKRHIIENGINFLNVTCLIIMLISVGIIIFGFSNSNKNIFLPCLLIAVFIDITMILSLFFIYLIIDIRDQLIMLNKNFNKQDILLSNYDPIDDNTFVNKSIYQR